MLASFDEMVLTIFKNLSAPYSDLTEDGFCETSHAPEALQARRGLALMIISWELQRVYDRPVVVLIDNYDLPMHCATEHDFSSNVCFFILHFCSYLMLFQANSFFYVVLSLLLKVCQPEQLRNC